MKKYIIIINLIFAISCYAGEFSKVGTSAAQFLKIGVGARAVAMGNTFGAMANDVNTIYWNPAGMVNIPNIAWSGSYTDWFADIAHQYTALVIPIKGNSALGFSATFVTMDEEMITTEENPQGTGYSWDATDIAVALSYARSMTDRFALGVTVKYISQRVWNESASTLAFDLGTYLNTGYNGITIGMCFSNFGGSLQLQGRDLIREYDANPDNSLNSNIETRLNTQEWPLPVNFRVGVSMEIMGQGDRLITSSENRFTIAVDGNHPVDDNALLNVGMEYAWSELLFARMGYRTGHDLNDFSFGGGLKFQITGARFICDYALAPYGELDDVQYFSVGLEF